MIGWRWERLREMKEHFKLLSFSLCCCRINFQLNFSFNFNDTSAPLIKFYNVFVLFLFSFFPPPPSHTYTCFCFCCAIWLPGFYVNTEIDLEVEKASSRKGELWVRGRQGERKGAGQAGCYAFIKNFVAKKDGKNS